MLILKYPHSKFSGFTDEFISVHKSNPRTKIMKKLLSLITVACISLPVFATPNNPSNPPAYFNNPNVPNYNWNNNRGSNWNMPNTTWGNNRGGSNFNMPNMNWGNNRGGSNFNMPNMNWGNNRGGNNWNMPNMDWGNNSGYGSGSNWNMPSMNWGNNNGYNNGSNWNMPNFNRSNNNRPWNYGNNRYGYGNNTQRPFIPNRQLNAPKGPKPPQFIPRVYPKQQVQANIAPANNVAKQAPAADLAPKLDQIPMPTQINGVILAPENKPAQSKETIKE